MGHLRAYYERIIKLQESEWEFIATHFNRKVFAKNQIIARQGATENHLSFIETGIVRFYIPHGENELTFNFSFNKEFTCAYDSFLTQTPSEFKEQPEILQYIPLKYVASYIGITPQGLSRILRRIN